MARASPERAALADRHRSITFGQLREEIASRADFVAAHAPEGHLAVGLILPNRVSSVATLLGTSRTGRVGILFSPSLTSSDLRQYCQMAGVPVLLAEPDHRALVEEAGGRVRGGSHRGELEAFTFDIAPREELRPGDFIGQLTSGADHPPKTAVRTHAAVWNEIQDFGSEIGLSDRDTVLVLPSVAHSYGLIGGTLAPLCRGGRVILLDRFDPEQVVRLIQRERPTILYAVPHMYRTLAETAIGTQEDLASLRVCFSAGAPLPAEADDGFDLRYGRRISQNYGTTEAGVISVRLEWSPELRGSVGRPVRRRIVTIEASDRGPLPPRSVGGVIVESPALARGYLGDTQRAGSTIENGRLLTGDLGWMSKDGHLFLTGRVSRLIRVAGTTVDLAEVERVIATLRGVRETAVIGVPRPGTGTGIKAVVVGDGLTAADVIRHCRQNLEGLKVPEIVEFRAVLPRTPAGKILRRVLSDHLKGQA